MKHRVLAVSLAAVLIGCLSASAGVLPGVGSRQEDGLLGPVESVTLTFWELGGTTDAWTTDHETQRVLTTYDRQGRMLEEEVFSEGKRISHSTAQYDEMGRLIQFERRSDDDHFERATGTYSQELGEIVWESYDISCVKTVIHCDISGRAISAEASADGDLLWSQSMDAEGRVIEQVYFRSGKPFLRKKWSYDGEGRLGKVLVLEEGKPSVETVKSYNADGGLKRSVTALEDGAVLSEDLHTYDSKGRLVLEDVLNPNYPVLGGLRIHYGYDDVGRLADTVCEELDKEGYLKSRNAQSYTSYDAQENWTSVTTTIQSFHKGVLVAQFGLRADRAIAYYPVN